MKKLFLFINLILMVGPSFAQTLHLKATMNTDELEVLMNDIDTHKFPNWHWTRADLTIQPIKYKPVTLTIKDEYDPIMCVITMTSVTWGACLLSGPEQGMDFLHTYEVMGFSYAFTDGFYRFLPKDIKWISPIIVGGLDSLYRLSEIGKMDGNLLLRKCALDGLGIVARFSFEI